MGRARRQNAGAVAGSHSASTASTWRSLNPQPPDLQVLHTVTKRTAKLQLPGDTPPAFKASCPDRPLLAAQPLSRWLAVMSPWQSALPSRRSAQRAEGGLLQAAQPWSPSCMFPSSYIAHPIYIYIYLQYVFMGDPLVCRHSATAA